MSNDWEYLPNAKHMVRALAHFRDYQEKWDEAAISLNKNPNHNRMWADAWSHLPVDENIFEYSRAASQTWTIRGAIRALMAYDDCAYMLDLTPEQIHLYACLGVPAAVLLEPAVKAMYNE